MALSFGWIIVGVSALKEKNGFGSAPPMDTFLSILLPWLLLLPLVLLSFFLLWLPFHFFVPLLNCIPLIHRSSTSQSFLNLPLPLLLCFLLPYCFPPHSIVFRFRYFYRTQNGRHQNMKLSIVPSCESLQNLLDKYL